MEVETKKRRRGEVEHLPASQLEATLGSTILSRGSAELTLDYLIDRRNFDLDALKANLSVGNLNLHPTCMASFQLIS
jgi:hypothetical protein